MCIRDSSKETMVNAVVLSGVLKDAQNTKASVERCILLVAPEERYRKYLLELLQSRTVPSRTAILRHRLTLHIGWCQYNAAMTEEMIKDDDIVGWGT